MRYPAGEKLEIIRLVEQSPLPVRRTLETLGIPRATFYRWHDHYQTGSTAGTISTRPAGPKPFRTARRSQTGSGTAARMRSGARSSSWP